jgi:hypothetical protein
MTIFLKPKFYTTYSLLEIPMSKLYEGNIFVVFFLSHIKLQTPVWRCSRSPKGSSSFSLVAKRCLQLLLGEFH